MDLVKKKSIAIRPETYARLTRLAAELKLTRLDGGMVSLDMAVGVLLDHYARVQVQGNVITIVPTKTETE
jgi:hypothetical protein